MPLPSSINDLSQTAGSNSPSGSESPSTIDDYLRVYASYIALLRDTKLALAGGVLTGPINDATPQTIASATTTDIGAATSNVVYISGTTTITGLGVIAAGARRTVRFLASLVLTHSATLILPTISNITTAGNDAAEFLSLGGGTWICLQYNLASGKPVAFAYDRNNVIGTVSQSGGVPTGSAMEAGSNANGNFEKFADGSMICTRTVSLGSVAVTAANGSLFNALVGSLSYPATFISAPVVMISVIAPSGSMWASGGSAFPGTTATQAFLILSPTSTTAAINIQFVAVGRWF